MKTVTIHDAKTNLSKYIAAAKNGEKIFIGGHGKAEVVLTKLSAKDTAKPKQRDFSKAEGKITDLGDAFSEETEAEISRLIYGE